MTQIADYVSGFFDGPHATPKEADSGPIFLGISNVTPEGRLDLSNIRHVSEEEFRKWTKRVTPQKDDIVFSYEATLHRYALIPEGFHGCLGRRMALIRPDVEKIIPRFLYYYMLSPLWREQVEASIINGATVNRVPLTKVPGFKVCIPDKVSQKKISDTLSVYDDLIENNRRRIALLEDAARQLYKEWFVRFRFPGHEHSKIIDGIPEGWTRMPLKKIATLNYGKALKAEDRVDGPFPVYGSSGIVGYHDKPLIDGPGIILGRKGNVGSVYWCSSGYFPIDTVYFVSAVEASPFLYHTLLNMNFMSTDVAVPGLNRDFAYSREVVYPEDSLVQAFHKEVIPIHSQIRTLVAYNDKLAQARDLLLPKLMRGEITV